MEMEEIFDKLQAVADRYDELNELISDPEVIADTARFMKLSKEEGSLRETVEKYNEYKQVTQTIKDDEEMLREIDDPDLTAMTKDEIASSKERQATLEKELEVLLIPKDPNDDKNIIMGPRGRPGEPPERPCGRNRSGGSYRPVPPVRRPAAAKSRRPPVSRASPSRTRHRTSGEVLHGACAPRSAPQAGIRAACE